MRTKKSRKLNEQELKFQGAELQQEQPSSLTSQHLRDFSSQFQDLLSPKNPKGTALLRYLQTVQNSMKVYSYEPEDILSESYLKGRNYILKTGKKIRKPEAWLRRTGVNIIREGVRANLRQEEMERTLPLFQPESMLSLDFEQSGQFNPESQVLLLCLAQLSSKDRRLLQDIYFKGLSFPEIQKQYSEEGEQVSIRALKKREYRAIKRLKAIDYSQLLK